MCLNMYKAFIKRLLDLLFACIILIIFLPVIIIITFVLAINNNGSPFFVQERPGKNEKIFKLIKFQTMNNKRDSNGNILPDGERITKIGKIIRKLSIDELPQLINVLKGDMSLVGPRPLLIEYLTLYNEKQKQRHKVKPGITGWAQVNGRNAIYWEEKLNLDVLYVNNISFFLDLKILFLTMIKVFKAEGINSNISATMEKFTGTKNN